MAQAETRREGSGNSGTGDGVQRRPASVKTVAQASTTRYSRKPPSGRTGFRRRNGRAKAPGRGPTRVPTIRDLPMCRTVGTVVASRTNKAAQIRVRRATRTAGNSDTAVHRVHRAPQTKLFFFFSILLRQIGYASTGLAGGFSAVRWQTAHATTDCPRLFLKDRASVACESARLNENQPIEPVLDFARAVNRL